MQIGQDSEGIWFSKKVIGDANVPAGKLSWQAQGPADPKNGEVFAVNMQMRSDINDPNGFYWAPMTVQYLREEDMWLTNSGMVGQFVRVTQSEADVMITSQSQQA